MSSPAAAISAAAFGPAAAASFDQPPVSRMLTKVSCACGKLSAISLNSGASWVQATVIGAPSASAALNRSSSSPQSWLASVGVAAQPRPIACASSGMVFSQLQIKRCDVAALIVNYPEPARRPRGCSVCWFAVPAKLEIRKAKASPHCLGGDSIHRSIAKHRMSRSKTPRVSDLEQPLDLPPGYNPVGLREVGDAFVHGCDIAVDAGAGTLVWVRRYDLVEFAVVLEPDEALRSARRAFFAGMNAVGDAIAAHCPPEREVSFRWPDTVEFDGGLLGGARLGWPKGCAEDEIPAWLVFGVILRAADMAHIEEVQAATGVSLLGEGFEMVDVEAIIGSFARHLMTAFDRWNERGFDAVGMDYLARLPQHKAGQRRSIDRNGDLLIKLPAGSGDDRSSLVDALAQAAWNDPRDRGTKFE